MKWSEGLISDEKNEKVLSLSCISGTNTNLNEEPNFWLKSKIVSYTEKYTCTHSVYMHQQP